MTHTINERMCPAVGSKRPAGVQVLLLAPATVLSGCATLSADASFDSMQAAAKARLGQEVQWARGDGDQATLADRIIGLLSKPLSVDDAIQVALPNNRGVQARFQDLGITEAGVVQAWRLLNPGYSFSRLKQRHEIELERGLRFNLARLLVLPAVTQVEKRRFEQVQRDVAMDVHSRAADTRKAYVTAVTGEETVRCQITKLIPDYMVMGERGMKDMTEMEMPLPDSTAAMATGQGPFGAVGMGGMFSAIKVRQEQRPWDYSDPSGFKHPPGTVAYEFTGSLPDRARFKAEGGASMPPVARSAKAAEVKARKPGAGHGGQH